MFEAFALALAASQLAAPAESRPPSLVDSGWPPQRYMGQGVAVVAFADDVGQICGRPSDPRYTILACASREAKLIVLPNPCAAQFREEYYARIACHEKGHINGWPGTHGG